VFSNSLLQTQQLLPNRNITHQQTSYNNNIDKVINDQISEMSAFNINNNSNSNSNSNMLKFSGKQIPIVNEDSNSNNYLNVRDNNNSSNELIQSNHNTIDSNYSRSNNNNNNNIKTYNPNPNVTNLAALTQMNQTIITRDRSITPGKNKKRYLIPKSIE
jgi:hypothetical protein